MLCFDIRALESRAVQVHGTLPADDPVWGASDARPAEAVQVDGRIAPAGGEGRFYFSGRIAGRTALACRRCLSDVVVEVAGEVHLLVAPAGDPAAADDPDVVLYDPGARELDLRPAVRESWLLEVPQFVQCSDTCRGLCPRCGTDLNAGACDCAPEATDQRWAALRQARDPSRP